MKKIIVNTSIFEQIKRTGLSEKEALVYTALAELGTAFPSYLAEVTKLNRSTTYKVLLDLSIKGLISESKNRGKLCYQIEKPQRLIRHVKDTVKIAEDHVRQAEQAIPELEGLFSKIAHKPKVRFFDGPDAVQLVCDDMVSGSTSYEMCAFSNAQKFTDYFKPGKLREFIKSKERLNITTRAIVPDTEHDRNYNENIFRGIKKNLWPRMRFVPKEIFLFDAEITIYGENKVSFTKLGDENLIGVIIEDKTIHNMMRGIFNLAWMGALSHVSNTSAPQHQVDRRKLA